MKKFLSIILALAMLVSLVPSVFAADKEYEVKYNYDFGAAGYGDGTSEIGIDTLKTYGDLTTTSQDSKDGHTWAGDAKNGLWLVDGHRNGEDIVLTGADVGDSDKKKPDSVYFYMYGTRVWTKNSETNKYEKLTNGALAMRLQIDEPGTYIPELTYYPREDLAIYDVYLVSLKTSQYYLQASDRNRLKFNNSGITGTVYTVVKSFPQTYLGQIDMYNTDLSAKTVKLNPYTVSEDEAEYAQFALLFYPNGMNQVLQTKCASKNGPAQYINLDSFKLYTEKKEEVSIDSSFDYTEEEFVGGGATLRAFAVYGEGTESEEDIIETRNITLGEAVEVEAPKSVTKGEKTYNFLYWAKGATDKKQIISYNSSFTYKAYAEANNLIAVYKEKDAESAKKEYYNANGQLMENGDTLPSLPGYGPAIGWQDAGNGVYVAEYAPLAKNIEITVNGEKESYAYGDTVTCTANAPEGKVFMYWKKDDEIVSTESTYTFCAWKNATVTAMYGDETPTLSKAMRKIIFDTLPSGEYTAVMAEFIGFGDAVEKGIIFGGKKIPMLTDKSQFTLTNDTENTVAVTGYAIINDNGTLKEISAGSISVD